ncbi:MAG: hypothetical protein KAU62_08860 [Candidatus Heimdallarchaeota archaeon]|nr:hypothetical protein [Candidatus Heimdallarchaeota archaeon]MCK4611248.1 hypothetical protein [Candidatus Heimdallarchaeota archaeon]
MRYLEVKEDGTLVELTELQLGPEKVLIVVDEEDKKMWLWKGSNCPIRKKFIGSRALSDIRKKEYGFAYVPQSCDQNDETAEFVAMLQKIGKTDILPDTVIKRAQKIIDRQSKINVFEEGVEQESIPASTPAPIPDSEKGDDGRLKDRPAQVPASELPTHLAKMGAPGNRPMPTILSALESESIEIKKPEEALIPKGTTSVASGKKVVATSDIMLDQSFKVLKDLGAPKGFYRDLVIIGNKVYTETYTGGFEELDEPPEGIFFSSSHVPRMICENGVVRAIEFLKPEEGAELSEEDEAIAQDIEDLLGMFEIEVG